LWIAHKSFDPPCDPIARKTLPRPPHPCPTFVTIAKRPSAGRDGRINKAVSTKSRSGIFLQRGLDTPVKKTPDGQITDPSCGLSDGLSEGVGQQPTR
jgi:hypothetical protein